MAIKNIIQHPNNILITKSKDITDLSETRNIVKDLIDTLSNSRVPGAGIAAPQIGINKRIFIVRRFYKKEKIEKFEDIICINPKIKYLSKEKVQSLEGCLSIKNTFAFVSRNKRVKLEYYDIKGNKKIIKAGANLASIIQHEYDHLEGILFIQKAIGNKTYSEKEIEEIAKNTNQELRID